MPQKSATKPSKTGSASDETVRQTIIETLEAPRLTDISTESFVDFKRRRELYERQVAEKNADSGVSIPLTSHRSSISELPLQMLVIAKWVPVSDTSDVTEDHLRDCVATRAKVKPEDYDLAYIQRGIQRVHLDKKEKSLEMQVWKLGLAFTTALEDIGCGDYINKMPHLAVDDIMRRITNEVLHSRMAFTIKLLKEEGFKKDIKGFMRQLADEAKSIDRQEAARGYSGALSDSEKDVTASNPSDKSVGKRKRSSRKRKGASFSKDNPSADVSKTDADASMPEQERKKRSRELPQCLNPKCKKRHRVIDCDITTPEERKNLLDAYYAERKKAKSAQGKGTSGKIIAVTDAEIESNSSLFAASFCDGAVEELAQTDQGSDPNLIPPKVFTDMKAADKSLKYEKLSKVQRYKTYDKSAPPIPCSHKVTATIMLTIRHGVKLILRGIEWMVSDKVPILSLLANVFCPPSGWTMNVYLLPHPSKAVVLSMYPT